jgi:CubicO group peptidase (beta-lactamase class C family)
MKPIPYVLFFCLSLSAAAQNLTADVDGLLKAKYKPSEPGATAIITKGDKIIYRQGFGMADLERNVTMQPEHVFEIGSITKQFTAVSILMLLEQGKLSLQDPLTKYIENYPQGQAITIHHLLTHTSGIKSYTDMEKWRKLWRNDMTPLEMVDIFKNEPVDFAPGEKFQYNNSAYFLLGYIIEKASGTPYPEFLDKNIFFPLGMKNSHYGSQSKIIKNRALGYQKSGDFINAEYLSLTQPFSAGSIMSNVDDLFTWNQAIKSNKLVKKETIQKAFTNYTLNNGKSTNYGYGWFLSEIYGSPTIEHSGGIFGYATNGIYLPKEDVYVAVLSNCDCNPPADVSMQIAALVIGKPFAKDSKIKLDEEYAKSLTGVYEFDDGATRMITFDNGYLYSQRSGSPKFKLFALDKQNFAFENDPATYQFKSDGKELLFKNRNVSAKGTKSDKPLPTHNEIQVSADILKQYVGVYEFTPTFGMTITFEDGHLMEQATGQQKFEIFPESQTKFFLKVVDAQIEFVAETENKFDTLYLYQGGRKLPAKRKS